jgi:uncharacterized protein (TIGR03437 family)
MLNRPVPVLALAVFAVSGAFGQKTTNFTFTATIATENKTQMRHAEGSGFGTLASLGQAGIHLDLTQAMMRDQNIPLEDYQGTISFVLNRLDSFDVAVTIPNGNGNPPAMNGNITAGKGAYQGATGSVTFNITGINATQPRTGAFAFSSYSIAASGSVTVAGKTTTLTMPATGMTPAGSSDIFRESNGGTITVSPIGSGSFEVTGHGGDNNTRQTTITTSKFNANDSVSFFFSFLGDNVPPNLSGQIIGGTGSYAGATGSVTLAAVSIAPDGSATATGSGAVTTGATGIPVITEVTTAFGNAEIAPNTWTVIKGTNLVPANTPAAGVDWSSAPEFASGKMPTKLQNISVTVNGVPAYVYFYCSAATNQNCASDQINILTPLEPVQENFPAGVVVTNGSVSSNPFIVNEVGFAEPSFLLFSAKGHVVGVHLDGSLLGPTSLYPGLSTPAKVGETVLVYAIGFGIPKGGTTQGSATQAGAVQATVNCSVGGRVVASVPANIISPGLTQLNLTIPAGTPSGDNLILCVAGPFPDQTGGHTPAGNLITVQ